jgi:hypothetical protein
MLYLLLTGNEEWNTQLENLSFGGTVNNKIKGRGRNVHYYFNAESLNSTGITASTDHNRVLHMKLK